MFRTLVPRVANGCEGRPAVLSKTVALDHDRGDVLFNGSKGTVKPLKGGQYILDVQYNDPSIREVVGTVWYTNGSKEPIKPHVSDLVDAGGHIAYELRSDGDWASRIFMSLDLEAPQGAHSGLKATVKLCSRT
jgi:alginate biosynthesis protein AlgX